MIKYTLITLFTSITLFFSAALADGVVIDHNLPSHIAPGGTTVVSVIINKGNVSGFAKLQLEIPTGLSAKAVKKNGASFTFSGQKAKFIWMSLPEEQEFSVEYELTANSNASGTKLIPGQFSYIKENERIDYDLAPQPITIAIGGDMAENTTSDPVEETTPESIPAVTASTDNTAICNRTVSKISDTEYFVELYSEGVTTDGFTKLIEDVSEGFEINASETGESIVTVEDDRIKFVWFETPADDSYSVSYSLIAKEANIKPEIDGTLSFVQNNQPQETAVLNTNLMSSRDFDEPSENSTESEAAKEDVIAATDEQETIQEEVAEVTPPKEVKTIVTPPVTQEPIAVTEEVEETISASNVPDPEVGIAYKVQLSATHKYITAEKFKSTHGFKGNIQTENHEGWTKFVTGSHDIYKDARDARNSISSAYPKFNGPFVTAYNSGERITVQEALMISKQKWYQ
ncbi:MAG: hypothetical protein AB8B53_06545 [Flavobacteriales bacterium]